MCHVQLEQRGACKGTVTSMKESVGVIKQVRAMSSVLGRSYASTRSCLMSLLACKLMLIAYAGED